MDRSGGLKFSKALLRSIGNVVAVEAKLLRWRDALAQAISYLRFANESYVALPKAVVELTCPPVLSVANESPGWVTEVVD